MKFQEPDLRGLSVEELKIRNGLEAAARDVRAQRPPVELQPRALTALPRRRSG
jgi:hypothetical protein